MLGAVLGRQEEPRSDQLLKLYQNRAGVKRELRELKRERYELLDRLKAQEGAIRRAQEQLEGLERLLTNPAAAANAMVYFQLRHLWRIGAQRLDQFGKELQAQRERRERAQMHEAVLAKRKRRLEAVDEKLQSLHEKMAKVGEDAGAVERQIQGMNGLVRLFRGPYLHRRLNGLRNGQSVLEEKITELNELIEKIQGEPLPEPENLSLDGRRMINTALIALAQHLVVHFSDHDLALLAKRSTEYAVGDMKFGDRGDCDRMVERIRESIDELQKQDRLADLVKQRTESLRNSVHYANETDSLPLAEAVEWIQRSLGADRGDPLRRNSDAPLRVNVLADDYWGLTNVLR